MDKIVDKDKRKAEWTAALIFTLDEIFMIMRTVAYDWGYFSTLVLLASLIGIVAVCLTQYKSLNYRSIIYSTIMSMSLFIHVTQMDTFMPIVIPTATFIIIIGVLGEIIAFVPAFLGFTLTILYH